MTLPGQLLETIIIYIDIGLIIILKQAELAPQL